MIVPKDIPDKIAPKEAVASDDKKSHAGGSIRFAGSAATPNVSIWYQYQRCGGCCWRLGFVHVSEPDMQQILRFHGTSEWEFIEQMTRVRFQRDGLALIKKSNGEGIFFDGITCTVQAVKPDHCRGFPNAWNFPGWRDVCEGIAIPVSTAPKIASVT